MNGPVNAELLVEIERLWDRVGDLYMGEFDSLNLNIMIDDVTLAEVVANSKEEGLVWLSDQYQRIEADLNGEV